MKYLRFAPILIVAMGFFLSCSSINCPLNNRVMTVYKMAGDVTPLADALTISTTRTNGTDSVLLNQAVNVDSFSLPVSYNRPQDVLYFQRQNTAGWSLTDTVVIEKQDFPHFESIECKAEFFHKLTGVRYTKHGIDSLVIKYSNVDYDDTKIHFYLYPDSERY